MKASNIYIVAILIFLALMFTIERSLPKKIVWNPTFSQYDHQPFGCAIFDDVVSASLSGSNTSGTLPAYSVTNETLYQLSLDSTVNRSLLVITDHLTLTETDREALLDMLGRGSRVMLVASNFGHQLADTLCFKLEYSYFSLRSLRDYALSANVRDSLYWAKDTVFADERVFRFFPHLFRGHFYNTDSLYTNVSMRVNKVYDDFLKMVVERKVPCAVTRTYGRGQITLVSHPLIFTNYGMLDEGNADYIFRLLNQLDGLPIVRVEAYGKYMQEYEMSPFRYFLSQPPLRWGLYMTLIVVLLFMIFTARREQRPIPVIRQLPNNTIAFVQLIGTLYFRKKDHTGLVQKKFIYFTEKLRRGIQIDIENGENDAELAKRISQKTGVDETHVHRLLVGVRPIIQGKVKIDEESMKCFIEDMNEIINHI